MGIGPAGLGVLHTSGNAGLVPLLALWTTVMKLTTTVAGMGTPDQTGPTTRAARAPPSAVAVMSMLPGPAQRRWYACVARHSEAGTHAAPISPRQSAG